MDAIGQARIFLLCLSQNSAVSEHVLNEVEMAYNKKRTASDLLIEPLCLEVLDLDAPEFDEIMYYIRWINFIAPSNLASSKAIAQEIITKNKDFLKLENIHIKKERTKSAYFTSERETARLELQTRLLRKFDGEIYRQVFEEYEEPDILDVGCGNGSMIFDRMDGCCENFRLIGIERDPDKVQEAGDKFGGSQVAFITGDVEKSDFIDDLADKMDEMGIEKFDIINISMLIFTM